MYCIHMYYMKLNQYLLRHFTQINTQCNSDGCDSGKRS